MIDELLKRIKIEIETDPNNKGYAGKTAAEIAELINSPTYVTTDIFQPQLPPPPGTKIGEKTNIIDAPVLKLLVGIPETENIITEAQVSEAIKIVLDK